MCDIGNVGRYFAHRGRNLAAQQPRTMRWSQCFALGETEEMVWAMRRMTVSASLSSCRIEILLALDQRM